MHQLIVKIPADLSLFPQHPVGMPAAVLDHAVLPVVAVLYVFAAVRIMVMDGADVLPLIQRITLVGVRLKDVDLSPMTFVPHQGMRLREAPEAGKIVPVIVGALPLMIKPNLGLGIAVLEGIAGVAFHAVGTYSPAGCMTVRLRLDRQDRIGDGHFTRGSRSPIEIPVEARLPRADQIDGVGARKVILELQIVDASPQRLDRCIHGRRLYAGGSRAGYQHGPQYDSRCQTGHPFCSEHEQLLLRAPYFFTL